MWPLKIISGLHLLLGTVIIWHFATPNMSFLWHLKSRNMTSKRWNMTLKKLKNFHIKHRKSVLLGFIVDSSQSLLWKQEFHLSYCVRFPLFQMFHIRSVGKLPSTYIINPQIYLSVCLSHPVSPEPLDLWSGNFYLSYERWGRFIQCHIRFISAVFGRKQQMEVELD